MEFGRVLAEGVVKRRVKFLTDIPNLLQSERGKRALELSGDSQETFGNPPHALCALEGVKGR